MSFEAEQADRAERRRRRRRIDMREIGRREGGEVRMSGAIWKDGVEGGEANERQRDGESCFFFCFF